MNSRWLDKFRSFLLKAAKLTYRTPGESPLSSGWDLFSKYALVVGLLGLLLITYGPSAISHVREWESYKLDVPVSATAWKLDLESSADCGDVVAPGSDCDANPVNPRLWKSPLERGDPYVALRSPEPALRHYQGSHFWIGAVIPPEVLHRAAAVRANHFILGWLNAPYRVWIDGQIVQEGDGTGDADPIVLMVPMSRLSDDLPLQIAVRLAVSPAIPIIDALNEDRTGRDLGLDGHGFATHQHAVAYHNLVGFWGKSRPFALALSFLVIAALMFFFWSPLKSKPEYFYMSAFAISAATFQCERFDLFNFGQSAATNSNIELLSMFWMPTLGLTTGLAFARVKQKLINRLLLALLAIPIAVVAFVPHGALQELFKLLTIVIYVPLGPFVAGAVCLIHAYQLAEQSRANLSSPVRIRRLTWFGFLNIANSFLFFMLFHNIGSEPKRIYWVGLEQMFFFISFCAIVLSEYSIQEKLVTNTPVSIYHQRPILPESVVGAILTVDLKNSERLFRAGASLGEGAQLVDKCLAALWNASVRSGGVVLQTEGDSLRALFDQASMKNPVANALETVNEMAKRLKDVEASLRSSGLIGPDEPPICFRGGLSFGTVRPVWHIAGKNRQAAWTEVGDTNAFVESSRLMELERSVQGLEHTRALVVMPENLVAEIPAAQTELSAGLARRQLTLIGKHGRPYVCAVYAASATLADSGPVAVRTQAV